MEPKTDKQFVVYLTKAPIADVDYDEWICGGALVSRMDIVTAAACLEDVKYMYAIAGFRSYVPNDQIKSNPCTRHGKKKVTLTCVPKNYKFAYDKVERWASIDIGVARVESEYDFDKVQWGCSYAPKAIEVNYDIRFQGQGKEPYVLGWGHRKIWRQPNDKKDYNSGTLLAGSTTIISKKDCLDVYRRPEALKIIIQKFMICCNGSGSIDPDGDPETINTTDTSSNIGPDGCTSEKLIRGGYEECKDLTLRRNGVNETDTFPWSTATRRVGICQNDHGGPLVAHIGSRDKLIGVASVFRINKQKQCVGPFLYTSTACAGAFLRCVLDKIMWNNGTLARSELTRRGVDECNVDPATAGFDSIDERSISWKDHPDGIADNERVARDAEHESTPKKRINTVHKTDTLQRRPQEKDLMYRPQIMTNGNPPRNQEASLMFRPQRPIKG